MGTSKKSSRDRELGWKTLLTLMIVFLGSQSVQIPLFAGQENCFGSKDPGLFNLKGNLHFLPDGSEGMPEKLEEASSSGVIYTDHLDVPSRSFTEGFPGVTERFEWFGLLYTGQFEVEKPGEYRWRLFSDDGSRLWIDGNEVIDNDGVHPGQEKDGAVSLTRGPHSIKVWYFQGPADEIAIQLFVIPPGGGEKIFSMKDFSADLGKEIEKVQAKPTAEGIKIQLDAAVLFDTGKSVLKPAAKETIQSVSRLISAYPNAMVKVNGFTDSVGGDDYNQKLSEARAAAVKTALTSNKSPAGIRFETQGFGKNQPVATNDTEIGRAKNRRVEVFIQP